MLGTRAFNNLFLKRQDRITSVELRLAYSPISASALTSRSFILKVNLISLFSFCGILGLAILEKEQREFLFFEWCEQAFWSDQNMACFAKRPVIVDPDF